MKNFRTTQGRAGTKRFLADAPAEIRDLLEEKAKQHRWHKQALINAIGSHLRNKFSADDLEQMSLIDLQNVAAIAGLRDPREDRMRDASHDGVPPAPNSWSDGPPPKEAA